MSSIPQTPALIALGVLVGFVAIRCDVRRRRLSLSPLVVTLVLAAAALIGAVFPGGQLRVGGALLWLVVAALLLARAYHVPPLLMLDMAALAVLMAISTARLFMSASVDYPNAAEVEGIFGVLFSLFLWTEGRRSVQWQRPRGIVLGEAAILGGGLDFILEFLQPLRPAGLSSHQITALVSVLAGAILLAIIVPRFLRTREEHRIIADVSATGESLQPEYTPATPECPHPELWKMYDSMSAEVEVLDFLRQLVITLKPNLVVETGTFMGVSTLAIAEGLKQNGFGRVITVEFDPKVFAKAKERIDACGLGPWIDARNQSSLDLQVEGAIDLLFSDSDIHVREREVRHFLPQISPTGLILIHDASSLQKVVREAALRLETEGLISVVLVPTPRGLVVAQKRSGRK
ncbi:MAG: class I SAM-dependent methyltransferase [Terriglobales bacterium]